MAHLQSLKVPAVVLIAPPPISEADRIRDVKTVGQFIQLIQNMHVFHVCHQGMLVGGLLEVLPLKAALHRPALRPI